jgi:hypothetical protein
VLMPPEQKGLLLGGGGEDYGDGAWMSPRAYRLLCFAATLVVGNFEGYDVKVLDETEWLVEAAGSATAATVPVEYRGRLESELFTWLGVTVCTAC